MCGVGVSWVEDRLWFWAKVLAVVPHVLVLVVVGRDENEKVSSSKISGDLVDAVEVVGMRELRGHLVEVRGWLHQVEVRVGNHRRDVRSADQVFYSPDGVVFESEFPNETLVRG